jgi:hypothetical protein
MATASVYSPINGYNWGQATYCYCCGYGTHAVVDQCCNPIDIGRHSQVDFYFYCRYNVIKSIYTVYEGYGVCADTSITAPHDALLRVDLYSDYNATGIKIGTVSTLTLLIHLVMGTIIIQMG